jgi:catechol O-methyltransferase
MDLLLKVARYWRIVGRSQDDALPGWERGDTRAMTKLTEIGGKRLPFLRWSAIRMVLGLRHLTREWQVGDGREEALAVYVESRARRGDVDDVIHIVDDYCYHRSIMMNVGDEKGEILDRAVQRARPHRVLELGTYCGYSALRMARAMPSGAALYSVEFSAANAEVARRIWQHAGVTDRVTAIVGSLGDGGQTLQRLEAEFGFLPGNVDFVFIDHDKAAYLPDLQRILDRRWLHRGSVVVADNVKIPGAPAYRNFMKTHEGTSWRSVEHRAHVEYQSILNDLVLESDYLGTPSTAC